MTPPSRVICSLRRHPLPALVPALVLGVAGHAPPSLAQAPRPEANADLLASQERPSLGTSRDWEIAREHYRWGTAQEPESFPHFGQFVVRLAERFVGTPYQPHTLELPGPERLVVNLETLDCVTLVENVLVLARLSWGGNQDLADDLERFQGAFLAELLRIRYRQGVLDGYASRLHYFSEWIADNAALGILEDRGSALGGVTDRSAVNFMSTHPDAYRQLADPAVHGQIKEVERRLGATPRHYLPAEQLEAAASGIRDGDIIAATSTVPGLDIAHTGFALWQGGTLHLLHAPLVGSHVQITQGSLAQRIARLGGQDGIMVARPLDPGARGPAGR